MDLDAYVAAHAPEWQRLEALTRKRRLRGAEADELVERYQQVATHLSVVRTSAPDAVAGRAPLLAAVAGPQPRGRRPHRHLARGAAVLRGPVPGRALPAALVVDRHARGERRGDRRDDPRGCSSHPIVEQSLLSPAEVDQLVNHDFEDYYSEYAASHFAAQVWVNNAWVAALCLALGVLGLPVIYLLFQNMANLAIIGSIMIRHDHGAHFWGLLLPHGLLELTAVFVAAGVGLKLFWSWVEPGELTRAQSLAREGRTAGTVALGLVAVLFVSGVIEAFVTPSGLPTWARVGIGITGRGGVLRLRVRARPRRRPPRPDRRHRRVAARGPGRHPGLIGPHSQAFLALLGGSQRPISAGITGGPVIRAAAQQLRAAHAP